MQLTATRWQHIHAQLSRPARRSGSNNRFAWDVMRVAPDQWSSGDGERWDEHTGPTVDSSALRRASVHRAAAWTGNLDELRQQLHRARHAASLLSAKDPEHLYAPALIERDGYWFSSSKRSRADKQIMRACDGAYRNGRKEK